MIILKREMRVIVEEQSVIFIKRNQESGSLSFFP